jgi:hypothetical protein
MLQFLALYIILLIPALGITLIIYNITYFNNTNEIPKISWYKVPVTVIDYDVIYDKFCWMSKFDQDSCIENKIDVKACSTMIDNLQDGHCNNGYYCCSSFDNSTNNCTNYVNNQMRSIQCKSGYMLTFNVTYIINNQTFFFPVKAPCVVNSFDRLCPYNKLKEYYIGTVHDMFYHINDPSRVYSAIYDPIWPDLNKPFISNTIIIILLVIYFSIISIVFAYLYKKKKRVNENNLNELLIVN